jgi:hypothetical protein
VIIEEGYVLYPGLRAFIIDGTSVNDIKIGVTFIRKQVSLMSFSGNPFFKRHSLDKETHFFRMENN